MSINKKVLFSTVEDEFAHTKLLLSSVLEGYKDSIVFNWIKAIIFL